MNNYIIYARKSSESEDKQVASIESQIDELKKLAQSYKLHVSDIRVEEYSAKAPGRPIFNKMLEDIHSQKAQGIICWKLDRLARNPIDGGSITWMLQKGVIKHIQTFQKSYHPTDNVLLMNVEFGMANQYVLDLSVNVKRGMRKKVADGWFPHIPPLGYINNQYQKEVESPIVLDPEKFYLIKSLWEELVKTQCALEKLHKKACVLGLRSKKGNLISRSHFYRIFKNPFYYGKFEWNGELYQGKHEAMISKEMFDKAQLIITGKYTSCAKYKTFKYTGLIKCGECGGAITAETKTKKQKNGNVHHYIYYRCTKRKKTEKVCTQKTIREENLEIQLSAILETITLPHSFHQWAIKALREDQGNEREEREKILKNHQDHLSLVQRKLETIFSMRIDKELSAEEYKAKKVVLTKEKVHLEQLIQDTHYRFDTWLEKAETLLSFSESAKQRFDNGKLDEKKQIIQALGQALTLTDRTLQIELKKPLIYLHEAKSLFKAEQKRLEPVISCLKQPENRPELALSEKWRGLRDKVRTYFLTEDNVCKAG